MSSFTSSRSAVSLSSSTWFQMRLKIKKKASIKLTWSISSTRRLCIARQVAWRASNMDRSFKWEINYRAWKFESTLHTSGCSRPGLSSDSISEKTAMFCCVTPRSPLTFATCSGCMSAMGASFTAHSIMAEYVLEAMQSESVSKLQGQHWRAEAVKSFEGSPAIIYECTHTPFVLNHAPQNSSKIHMRCA